MRRCLHLAAVGLVSAAPAAAAGEGQPDVAARALASTFESLCVHSVPDLDRVEVEAARTGLVETTGSDRMMPRPPAGAVRFRTWRLTDAAFGTATLSITGGRERGKAVAACAVTSVGAEPAPALAALKAALQLGRAFRTEADDSQRILDWNLKVEGRTLVISATDASPASAPGISLAATSIGH